MKQKSVTLFNALVIIALTGVVGYQVYDYLNSPRIGYVRSYDLIEKYKGTLEARAKFEKKKSAMIANVDSLRIDFERSKNQYFSSYNRLTGQQREEHEKTLTQQQNQLVQYSEVIDQRIEEEDNKMMQEVLNQINSYVEEYATREDYDIIMGTTLSGSLLYGRKSMDITETLVDELNTKYAGK